MIDLSTAMALAQQYSAYETSGAAFITVVGLVKRLRNKGKAHRTEVTNLTQEVSFLREHTRQLESLLIAKGVIVPPMPNSQADRIQSGRH